MQDVSNNYKTIVAGEHWFEARAKIGETVIQQDGMGSLSVTHGLFSEERPMIGCACSAECTVKFFNPVNIPRMAKFSLEVRAKNGSLTSEWIPKGSFYVDTRTVSTSFTEVHGFDAMMLAEKPYPTTETDMTAAQAASRIAEEIGVTLDPRTYLPGVVIPSLVGYTCREALRGIATLAGGNWTITDAETLLLVPLNTGYLVDENGAVIVFADGTRILL